MERILMVVLCLLRGEEGVTAIEYALIASLIAVMILLGATALGINLNAIYTTVAGLIPAP